MSTTSNPPAGFYDHEGRQRWWDGTQWTEHYQTPAPATAVAPPSQPIQVTVQAPVQTDARKARDKAVYTRQQTGHSLTLWIILSVLLFIPVFWLIYFSVSPNHYWHA
jgi:hypothetical protein